MKKSARYLRRILILLAIAVVIQDRIPAFGKEARTVRVGFFSCNGFQDVNQDGSLGGFSYDYLEAISQYMGWKMEYVTGYSLESCLAMLKEGKLDMVNGVYKTAERQAFYAYPEVNVGTSTSCLITTQENSQIQYGDYAFMNHTTVGLLKGSSANDDFFSFCKEKGIDFNVVYYESADDVYKKLDNKEIDVGLITSIQKTTGYRVIAKFAAHTFYAITNKQDVTLMEELNQGISSLKIYQPEFESLIEERYYLEKDGMKPALTKEEQTYIKNNPVIKVFCDPNWYPVERYDFQSKMYEGIAADVFREIEKGTGLKFEFVESVNFTEAINKMKEEDNCLFSALTFDYQFGNEHQVSLTQPYITTGIQMIQKRNGQGTTIALPKGYFISKYIAKKYPDYPIIYFDTVEECIAAVRNGQAATTYANTYESEYFLNMPQNRILKSRAIYSVRQDVSIGVSKRADPLLFSIISKGLHGISDADFLEMVRAHSVMIDDVGLLDIMYANPLQFVLIWAGFLVLMIILFYLLFRARERTKENQILKVASQAKSEFLSRMSHDMRTPMNVILGMSSYGIESKPKKEELLDCMEKIHLSGEYLLTLINDTLDMSKIENHKMELNYEPIRMPDILLILESIIGTKASERDIHFRVQMDNEEQEYYMMDKLRVQQVLLNILTNSVKYTPAGGFVELTIQELQRNSHSVKHRFIIQDNGEGMSEEFQQKVFQPFEQEKNKKIVGETGTGLGLAICKNLVEMMGGTISFQSKKNLGTTFYVEIESELASIREMNRNKKQVIHEIGNVVSGKRVLIVEDQPMNTQIVSMILRKAGMIIESAENGVEAIEAFRKNGAFYYDVILMDVRMPVMDGLCATEQIRSIAREDAGLVPIIAMTANAFDHDIKMCIQSGMNAHLSKPIEPQLLFQVISGWVKQTHKDPWPDGDNPENEDKVTTTIYE